jgi:ATP-dependent Zn protease
MSGAGLQQLVRDGRRAARRGGTPFGFEHIIQVARPLIKVPTEHMRVAAYHEAGHAIVGLQFGMELQGIGITDTVVNEGINTLGGARFAKPRFPMKSKSYYLDHIAMFLGGLAAETLVFGEFTDAATNYPRSDLGIATALATKVEACFGMGSTLAVDIIDEKDLCRLRANDPKLRAAVSELLDNEFKRAKSILDLRHQALQVVAETLIEAHVMSAAEVTSALDKYPAREPRPAADTDEPDHRMRSAGGAAHHRQGDEVRREIGAAVGDGECSRRLIY